MRIAVDAMGGDHAPREVVRGAVAAAHEIQGTLILVGRPDEIQASFPGPCPANVMIHPAQGVVGMEAKPTEALRRGTDTSIAACIELVKTGQADAVVSAGNTGAAVAASQLGWRQMPGIHRPAIASLFPSRHGRFLLLDAGASPDVDPDHLVEFAIMGRAYAEATMGRTDPRVHLLNIGEEPGKGNAFAKKAFERLAKHDWFAGNIEGKDMFRQECDVVVCDAFLGNVVLKTAEGVAEFIMSEIRQAIPDGPARLLYLPMRTALQPLRKKVDYAEYGGMPLLGLNGLTIIGHGRSDAKAVLNAVRQAAAALNGDVLGRIRRAVDPAGEAP
ncbi:MAG: phosphate acyltransferase PlsX [Fimbriimonadaceae bacterium]|nr:phosphate acyltransferase PlsX [Fimbriimonadaceae bacterium]